LTLKTKKANFYTNVFVDVEMLNTTARKNM